MLNASSCPISHDSVNRQRLRPVCERALALLAAMLLFLAVALTAEDVVAEVDFPNVGGTYKGLCPYPHGFHDLCEELPEEYRYPSCPDTLYVQQTGFSRNGPNGESTSYVSGQWLACNYYYPGRYIEEDGSCDPPPPAFGVGSNPLRDVSTAIYQFDTQLEWIAGINAIGATTSMNLVEPSAAASQREYVAETYASAFGQFAFGTRDVQARQSYFPTDWDDGTT